MFQGGQAAIQTRAGGIRGAVLRLASSAICIMYNGLTKWDQGRIYLIFFYICVFGGVTGGCTAGQIMDWWMLKHRKCDTKINKCIYCSTCDQIAIVNIFTFLDYFYFIQLFHCIFRILSDSFMYEWSRQGYGWERSGRRSGIVVNLMRSAGGAAAASITQGQGSSRADP